LVETIAPNKGAKKLEKTIGKISKYCDKVLTSKECSVSDRKIEVILSENDFKWSKSFDPNFHVQPLIIAELYKNPDGDLIKLSKVHLPNNTYKLRVS
jgi:hypothetical protein